MEETINEESVLLIDQSSGIYIPHLFWNRYYDKIENLEEMNQAWEEKLQEDLANPNQEMYWEAFDYVVENAVLVLDDEGKKKYNLLMNQDLWAILIE